MAKQKETGKMKESANDLKEGSGGFKQNLQDEEIKLIRIAGKDISGDKTVFSGLTKMKGVSWSMANAICKKLNINEGKRIQELNEKEIQELNDFIKNPEVPGFLKNRQKDFDSGEDKHMNGSDLELRNEFDIKRLRKISSYRGARHASGRPVRGQRTKANFRKNRKKGGIVGVKGKGK